MLGAYDFCGHYEWTFEWLRQKGDEPLVRRYWKEAIAEDSQVHASELIKSRGFAGMEEYWGHTLAEEGAGYTAKRGEDVFRVDMHECPSKGFLIRNGLVQYSDYCDHCMGWIGPVMEEAGFQVDHEHNHQGQCWWEIRRAGDATTPPAAGQAGADDVRLGAGWQSPEHPIDVYQHTTDPTDKTCRPPGA